ncbi:type IV pilus twitching motility protein PilT [Bacillus cereus]|uniref:type IV pilus twitching motility protein PilT n=1 Tax=Bacillus cereus TaxID=1396 RepID=UPI000BFB74A6|nr:PilT/PilU family type 4a pilus ATPase [Bacillus cereus]PGP12550.1 type IV pili twitching motility protein PilT [Bacillus cereus]
MLNWLNDVLIKAKEMGASDVHLSCGSPIIYRIDNDIVRIGEEILDDDRLFPVARGLLPDVNFMRDPLRDYDFSYDIPGVSRFRVNLFRQRRGWSFSIRLISNVILDMNTLGLPMQLKNVVRKKNGIFLVTGPTGSGKSTTLASMIQYVNTRMSKHIITLEDPIEFVYESAKAIIHQREIGHNVTNFKDGIRSALRQDPDIILVGEMRDLETISAAISAAETGHLVFGTLHTNSAPKTIDRIIDAFPSDQQNQVRTQFASLLVGILSQQLVKKASGKGRVAVTEFLLNNNAIANLIRTEKIHQIPNAMQTGASEGMHTMKTKVDDLLNKGVISENHGLD